MRLRRAVWLLAAVTGVKLALAGVWGWTADIQQTFAQATAFLAGQDYFDPGTTAGGPAYFPLGHYLLASGCLLASKATGVAFAWWIKTPAILADLGVSLLLRAVPKGGDRAAFLYMFNPVTFLLSVYHGQLHTVAAALAVWSLWMAQQGRWGRSGVLLGLAASIRQHLAVLLAPLVRGSPRRAALIGGCAAILLAISPWVLRSAHPGRVLSPTWTYGSWGYTLILLQGPRLLSMLGLNVPGQSMEFVHAILQASGSALYLAWAAVFAWWAWRRPEQDLWRAALLYLIGLYVVSPGFGVQWLIWAVPFWLIVDRREAVGFSLLAGAFVAGSYWQWSLNAAYGVRSLTEHLSLLRPMDLAGLALVGAAGVATWAYCLRAAWRLAWR